MKALVFAIIMIVGLSSCNDNQAVPYIIEYQYDSKNGTTYYHDTTIMALSEDIAIAEALEIVSQVENYSNVSAEVRYAKTYNNPKGKVIFRIN